MEKTYIDSSIKYYRKKQNLKQSELAQKLGVTKTDMSFIENKKVYPAIEQAELLSNILEVTIGSIYSPEELELILYKGKND